MKTANTLRLFVLLAGATLTACHLPTPMPPPPLADDRVLTIDAAFPAIPQDPFARSTDIHGATRIYHNTFEAAPGPEWSDNKISRTPNGEHPYLGDFGPRTPVTLSLTNLPRHDLVRISFDLYIMGGWSGSSPAFGYSRWDMDLADGRNLIHTTFCNWGGAYNNNNEQAFPDTYPARPHPGWTLAAEKQTLGTMINTQFGKPYDGSAVYHLVLTFPHTDKDIVFAFHSMEQGWKEKYYGFANITVEALPALPLRTDAELAGLWKDLGGIDPQKFFADQWELAAAGDQAVDYIARHREESIDPPPDDIRKLIDALESSDDEHLSANFDKLTFQGHLAIGALRNAIAQQLPAAQ